MMAARIKYQRKNSIFILQILDKNYLRNLKVLNVIQFNGILYGRIQTHTKKIVIISLRIINILQ